LVSVQSLPLQIPNFSAMTETLKDGDAVRQRLSRWAETALPSREIWTENQLQRLLEKERYRAGRRELPFAFVTWELVDGDDQQLWQRFGRLACETLRLTDEVGSWKGGIAILLTDTEARGAELAANKLRDAAMEQSIGTIFEIYVYPDRLASEGSADFELRQLRTRSSRDGVWREDSGHGPSGNSESESGDSSQRNNSRSTGAPRGTVQRTAQGASEFRALGQLFERSVPFGKRAFDLIASVAGLILLAPLLAGVALAVKLTSPGPVIFTQRREGRGGLAFTMFKFRTMSVGAEARQAELRMYSEQDGPAFKMTSDPRLTSIGKFLRKTCLDEAPQLINVIKGEMSIVGPRPLPVSESQGCTTWQRRRLDVLPGMTCSWQAEAARQVTFDDWMRLDLRYARRPRLMEDLRLIGRTVVTLARAKASV